MENELYTIKKEAPSITPKIDKLEKLERQIEKIMNAVEAKAALLTQAPREVKNISTSTQPSLKSKAKPEEVDRLKNLENQLKELIQITINKENKPIIIQKVENGNANHLKQQRAAFKILENQIFGSLSPYSSCLYRSSSDEYSKKSSIPASRLKNQPECEEISLEKTIPPIISSP